MRQDWCEHAAPLPAFRGLVLACVVGVALWGLGLGMGWVAAQQVRVWWVAIERGR